MPHSFLVSFQGSTVECSSLEDAVAIQAAETILEAAAARHESPAELDRIAAVLSNYGRDEAAQRVGNLASPIRAMQFVLGVGTELSRNVLSASYTNRDILIASTS